MGSVSSRISRQPGTADTHFASPPPPCRPPSYSEIIKDEQPSPEAQRPSAAQRTSRAQRSSDAQVPDEQLLCELRRIRYLGKSLREFDYDYKVSRNCWDLVAFIWDVLEVDYDSKARKEMPPARHAKFTRCALQLHYNTLRSEKKFDETPEVSIIDLDKFVYKPADEVDILPEAIDMILRRYLKYTTGNSCRSTGRSSCYTSCFDSMVREGNIPGIVEKIFWDGIYLSPRICSVDNIDDDDCTRTRSMDQAAGRIGRKYVPKSFAPVLKQLKDEVISRNALEAARWQDEKRASPERLEDPKDETAPRNVPGAAEAQDEKPASQ